MISILNSKKFVLMSLAKNIPIQNNIKIQYYNNIKPHVKATATSYYYGNQLASLYNIPVVKKTGTRQVSIAIIIAYASPPGQLVKDLKTYWTKNYGSSAVPPTINIHTMKGATQDSGWYQEECLDVQMVATVNSNATIWVVEAKSASYNDLNSAITYATNTLNADILSMSWGGNDTQYLLSSNSVFVNPSSSSNYKCFCASSGDNNYVSWPAVLSNCIAVGGSSVSGLSYNTKTESTWSSAGCGYSTSVAKPAYQNNINSNNKRSIPDVSLIANPNTGVVIICLGAAYVFGGTSVSCPIFAGILSLANQTRFNSNKLPLTTVYTQTPTTTQTNSNFPTNVQNCMYNTIYTNKTNYANAFYDIKIGSDGIYKANTNVDVATGLGSPNVTNLCNFLAA